MPPCRGVADRDSPPKPRQDPPGQPGRPAFPLEGGRTRGSGPISGVANRPTPPPRRTRAGARWRQPAARATSAVRATVPLPTCWLAWPCDPPIRARRRKPSGDVGLPGCCCCVGETLNRLHRMRKDGTICTSRVNAFISRCCSEMTKRLAWNDSCFLVQSDPISVFTSDDRERPNPIAAARRSHGHPSGTN